MAVSRISRSLSLSPLSRAFDAKYDLSSFLLCPELTLGDLAMPGTPITSLDSQNQHAPAESAMTPDISLAPALTGYLDCEASINFQDPAITPDSPAQHGIVSCQIACALENSDVDFTASLGLISRAITALTPFARFARDAQLLLAELGTLTMQLNFLRQPLPFLPKSSTYYHTVCDIACDIKQPLQEFLVRLEKLCRVEDMDSPRSGLTRTSTASQFRKLEWIRGVKDDSRKMRTLVGSRSSKISYLTMLVSM